ncbi:helix-turn-helix domain-containing protein [Spirillospora sp. CA-294931]|uniref:helix-turn-helix domain-containing protein n=1 Tax=Spirillospora sp. CA-294931 TaxID=3240042 RepID=UPI003D908F4D
MSERPVVFEDRGGWWMARSRPHPALRPYLAFYDGYWEDEIVPTRMRTVPIRATVVIINLGAPLLLRVPDPATPDVRLDSFVAGMHDGHGGYVSPGGQRGIQLDLGPLSAYTLLGVPMAAFTNIAVDLGQVLGPEYTALVARLGEAPGWAERFDLLDAFLLRRLERGPSPAPEVRRAWGLLTGSDGLTSVADLAGDVGWSRKHLTNRFREQVGLTPKVMARVLRFQRAVELMRHGAPSWVDIAVACGYYDQAHLNREFRALAGCTPTELLAVQGPEPVDHGR